MLVVLFIIPSVFIPNLVLAQNEPDVDIFVVFAITTESYDNDHAFIDAVDEALNDAQMVYSGQLNIERYYPQNETYANSLFSEASINGTYELIIGVGFGYVEAISNLEQEYSQQKFLLIDGAATNTNQLTRSIIFKEHEGSFLAGALAAMVSKTNKFGFIGGLNVPLINRFKFGFRQGVNFIGDYIGVNHEFHDLYVGSFADQNRAAELTNVVLAYGVDIVFTAAGSSNLGVFETVKDYQSVDERKVYAIGVDRDQDNLVPGSILTSMIKRIDTVLYNELLKLINDEWIGGTFYYGIDGGYVGISDMKYTAIEKNFVEARFNSKSRAELIQYLETAIIQGDIIVNEDRETAEIFTLDENPFLQSSDPSFLEMVQENQVLIGVSIFSISLIISTYILRDRIIQIFRKSDKEKAIEYLDQAKKLTDKKNE